MDMEIKDVPLIRKTITYIPGGHSYDIDLNGTLQLMYLHRLVSYAACIPKENFKLIGYDDQKDYTELEEQCINEIFPNNEVLKFKIEETENYQEPVKDFITIQFSNYCTKHQTKYLTFFCYDCNQSLCTRCKDEQIHKTHKIIEKIDYINEASVLVKDYINKDPSFTANLKNESNINEIQSLLTVIKDQSAFKNIRNSIDKIEDIFQKFLNLYLTVFRNSRENLKQNMKNVEPICSKCLEKFKEKIGIRGIVRNENIFKTYDRNFRNLMHSQSEKMHKDLQKYQRLNEVLSIKVIEYIKGIIAQIEMFLNKIYDDSSYEELRQDIIEQIVKLIEETNVDKTLINQSENLNESEKSGQKNTNFRGSNMENTTVTDNTLLQLYENPFLFNQNYGYESVNPSLKIEEDNKSSKKHNVPNTQPQQRNIKDYFSDSKKNTEIETKKSNLTQNASMNEKEEFISGFNQNAERPYFFTPIPNTTSIKVTNYELKEDNYNIGFSSKKFKFLENEAFCNTMLPKDTSTYLFVSGGVEDKNNNVLSKQFFKISVSQQGVIETQQLKNLRYPRKNHSMIVCGDYVFIVGGNMRKECEVYSISSNHLRNLNALNEIRESPTLFIRSLSDDLVYLYAAFGLDSNGEVNTTIERICLKNVGDNPWELVSFANAPECDLKLIGAGIIHENSHILFVGGRRNNDLNSENEELEQSADIVAFEPLQNYFFKLPNKSLTPCSFIENLLYHHDDVFFQTNFFGNAIGIQF